MSSSPFTTHPRKTLLLVNLFILLLFIFTAEKYLAWATPNTIQPTQQRHIALRQHPPNSLSYFTPPPNILSYTDNLIVQPYRLETDENGFIYSPYNHAHPDLTLLFLGGSTTENMYIAEDSRFPYAVGHILTDNGRPTNSYNAGFSGNHTLHTLNILLNQGIATQPDIAIMMHNINDAVLLMYQNDYYANQFRPHITHTSVPSPKSQIKIGLIGLRDTIIPNLAREINLIRAQNNPTPIDEFATTRQYPITINSAVFNQQFATNLQLFIDICRAHQIEPILMTQPSRFTENPEPYLLKFLATENRTDIYPQLFDLHQSFNKTIRQVGQTNQVQVIDLAAEIPPNPTHLYDIIHFTDIGSLSAANIIVNELEKSPTLTD